MRHGCLYNKKKSHVMGEINNYTDKQYMKNIRKKKVNIFGNS